jgi:Tfp pilus assembly protein PilF
VYAYTDELAEWLDGAKIAAEHDPESTPDSLRGVAADAGTEQNVENGGETGAQAAATVAHAGFVDRRVGDRRSGAHGSVRESAWPAGRYLAILAAVLVAALLAVTVVRRASSARAVRTTPAALRHHTPDPEAEQLYLKGIYYWQKRTPETLNQAVDYFTQAVVRDPQYAEAYVGLADCYNLLREYSVMPPSEAYPRAMAAAKRAIALDDSLSGAHSSMAFVDFYWSWDVASAQHEFERAIELDPKSVIAHHWYATFLLALASFPQSLEEIEKAQQLDPESNAILAD